MSFVIFYNLFHIVKGIFTTFKYKYLVVDTSNLIAPTGVGKIDAQQVISNFCELFPPETSRKILWLWLSETLSAADTQYEDAGHRADLLLFYDELLKLLEANHALYAPAV